MKIGMLTRIELEAAEASASGTAEITECSTCLALVRESKMAEHVKRAHG